MYEFEVGDRVKVKDNGKEGVVESAVRGTCDPLLVKFTGGSGRGWYEDSELEILPTTNDAGEDTSMSVDETLEQRGKRYGTFVKHSELSQSLLRTIRTHALLNDKQLSDVHTEALTMICHKMARIVNGDPNYDDSWRDIAGYATLVEKHINGEDV